MSKEAKPYEENGAWSMRRRIRGEEFYVSGERSAAAARKEMKKRVDAFVQQGAAAGLGPHKTTVAQALQDYGRDHLPFMKGAVQEAKRINRYLRLAGLHTLKVTAWAEAVAAGKVRSTDFAPDAPNRGALYVVELEAPQSTRKVPKGLGKHRAGLEDQTAASERIRRRLAFSPMAEVQRIDVQDFVNELKTARRSPATIGQERAMLRGLFNYARTIWNWSEPGENPATGVKMPPVDNGRERVMSADEQTRLDEAIQDCRNDFVGPTIALLTKTAMRASESLDTARWKDVDWERKVLRLVTEKGGMGRDVPLSPAALDALRRLRELNPGEPDERIIRINYESLKATWTRACERAGVTDLRVQDLRHTAATRMALKSGNVFRVKALTGHRTFAMFERYVNVKADDVVQFMHSPDPTKPSERAEQPAAREEAAANEPRSEGNVVHVALGRRSA